MNAAPHICPLCAAPLISDGRILVDFEGGLIVGGGQVAHLTKQEFDLFMALWQAAPRVMSKEALLGATADRNGFEEPEIKIIDVYICKARKKLAPLGIAIETAWGRGYRIVKGDPKRSAAWPERGENAERAEAK